MGLIYAGIDEAGYGPLLGPLCVGMAVLRVADWAADLGPPDLWRRLSRGVCAAPRDPRGRVAVADSKRLKLPSSSKRRHPLTHLERGVLAFINAGGGEPADDADLLSMLGAEPAPAPWYQIEPTPIPLGTSGDEIRIAGNLLRRACAAAGVEVLALRLELVDEHAFNTIVRRAGTKAETTLTAIENHLARVGSQAPAWGEADDVRIVCDRLGGRTDYRAFLARALGGGAREPEADRIRVLEQSTRVSAYEVDAGGRTLGVQFRPECEAVHLPVALASMIAKYARELAMARFNAYWCARDPSLKPTAGYRRDAARWLADANHLLSERDRHAMIRLA